MDTIFTEEKAAVTVRNAYKTYDKRNYVLRGLNMTAKEGTIYGLLGASGCGKSTLLNAIIGLDGLNSGSIELSITKKSDLGFMPQAICLYDQFTVGELLSYYGTMYGMSQKHKQFRIELMYKILELPEKNKCIPHLSGGQKRRVSLAIALLHDPKLLILDEPTVGVDPVLRQRIWDFLIEWSQTKGRTIIITTHYIQEMLQAHTVALMREGVMLCEKSPQSIMADCHTEYLEDAFLKLSQAQTKKPNDLPLLNKKLHYCSLSRGKENFSHSRFIAEVKKNFIFLIRNLSVAAYILFLPTLSIAFFDVALGRDPKGLKVSVVNDEIPRGIQFCENYVYSKNDCDLNYLSCHYLKLLREKSINLVNFDDTTYAVNQMNATNTWAVLHFTTTFTTALVQRIENPKLEDEDLVDNSTVQVYIDSSNIIVFEILKHKLRTSYLDMVQEVTQACDFHDVLVNLPIKFENPIYGKKTPSFREFAAPGLMMIIMFGMPLTYGVVIVIEEKNSGATSRSLVAGTSLFEVMLAHAVVQISVQLFHTITCVIAMYGILKYPFGQPWLAALILLMQGFSGIAFAFTLTATFSSILTVAVLGIGITIGCTIIGGLMWPLEGMDPYLRSVSWIAPSTYPAQALRSLTQRGWNLTHKDVYLGFISSTAWILIFTLYTIFYVRYKKNKVFVTQKVG